MNPSPGTPHDGAAGYCHRPTYYYFPQRHLLLDVTGADLSGDSIVLTHPDGAVERCGYDGGR